MQVSDLQVNFSAHLRVAVVLHAARPSDKVAAHLHQLLGFALTRPNVLNEIGGGLHTGHLVQGSA